MNNNEIQKVWQELQDSLFCCRCKAGKLLIWDKPTFGDIPHTVKHTDNKHVYTLHCEYFKKPIPNASELKRCAAHQAKKE